MKITAREIRSGLASGKVTHDVEGYGSFQTVYYEPFVGCMSTAYIVYSKKYPAQDKLCQTLRDVANHLGCDVDELCDNLPDTWTKERISLI